MTPARRASALILLSFAAFASGCQSAEAIRSDQATPAIAAPTVPLTIRSAEAVHAFRVELARTPQEQAQGLMYRTSLAADAGMLFLFNPPESASFWMKNTLIPLDMIFIRPNGTIARIAANTTPLSLEPVDAGAVVTAVLEIPGGRAAALGIREGDRVSWPGGAH